MRRRNILLRIRESPPVESVNLHPLNAILSDGDVRFTLVASNISPDTLSTTDTRHGSSNRNKNHYPRPSGARCQHFISLLIGGFCALPSGIHLGCPCNLNFLCCSLRVLTRSLDLVAPRSRAWQAFNLKKIFFVIDCAYGYARRWARIRPHRTRTGPRPPALPPRRRGRLPVGHRRRRPDPRRAVVGAEKTMDIEQS